MTASPRNNRLEFEAAAFRRLVSHLRERSDVQNIDMMNLAGFCRNCLSNWYRDAANAAGVDMDKDDLARDRLWHALRRVEGPAPEPRPPLIKKPHLS
jgi:hypothetical protein